MDWSEKILACMQELGVSRADLVERLFGVRSKAGEEVVSDILNMDNVPNLYTIFNIVRALQMQPEIMFTDLRKLSDCELRRIKTLEEVITIRGRDEVIEYLTQYPELIDVVVKVSGKCLEIFNTDNTKLYLEMFISYENSADRWLSLYVRQYKYQNDIHDLIERHVWPLLENSAVRSTSGEFLVSTDYQFPG